MVQITEASVAGDKALRGLAASVSLRDGETVESDFYQIKDAMLDWKHAHGVAAANMLIEYHASKSSWQAIEQFWHARIDSDHLVRSVFCSVREVTLCFMSPDGREIRQVWLRTWRPTRSCHLNDACTASPLGRLGDCAP
jgi:hypothetical protein